MAGITSLLKSAQATRKKIQSYNDQVAAFEWENSAQTLDDFIEYQDYLDGQSSKTSDASDVLTYQGKIRSARRSFISNEVQREQIKIMEGTGSTQDKMNAVKDLFYMAQDNGDLNSAQNLLSQWDALSIKFQNEQETAAKAFASSGKKAFTKAINDLTKGYDDITLPTGEKVTPLAAIAEDLETTGGSDLTWKAASDTLEAIRGLIIDKYNNPSLTQDELDDLEEKYGSGLKNIDKELTFNVGGSKLTAQEVVNAEANEQFNNPVYSLKAVRNEATGQNEFKLQPNNVEKLDYIRQFDEQGNEYFVPATIRTSQDSLYFGNSDQGRGLKTQITDYGTVIGGSGNDKSGKTYGGQFNVERNAANTIEERLKRVGIEAKQNGTTITIKLPGEGVDREATIQPDGSIRYYDDAGQLIEIGLTDRNLGTDLAPLIARAGQQRAVSPEEISDFGQASAFGGTLSAASAQGGRYVQDILGNSPLRQATTGPLAGPIRVGNDFSGMGSPVTSNLLQSASQTRKQIELQNQRQAMLQAQNEQAARLQASVTPNLNQVPIQQLTSQGILKRQLQVAAPTAQPRLYVAQPSATQQVTSVGVAQPTNRVTGVGVSSGSQQKLVVR